MPQEMATGGWAWHPVHTVCVAAAADTASSVSYSTVYAGDPPGIDHINRAMVQPLAKRAIAGFHGAIVAIKTIGCSRSAVLAYKTAGYASGASFAAFAADQMLKTARALAVNAWAIRSDGITDLLAMPRTTGRASLSTAVFSPPAEKPFLWPHKAGRRPALPGTTPGSGTIGPRSAEGVDVERVMVGRLRSVHCPKMADVLQALSLAAARAKVLESPARKLHSSKERIAQADPVSSGVHVFVRFQHASGGSVTIADLAEHGYSHKVELGPSQMRARAIDGGQANRDAVGLTKVLAALATLGDHRKQVGDSGSGPQATTVIELTGKVRNLRVPFRDSKLLRCLQTVLDSDCETLIVGFLGSSSTANDVALRQLGCARRMLTACPVHAADQQARGTDEADADNMVPPEGTAEAASETGAGDREAFQDEGGHRSSWQASPATSASEAPFAAHLSNRKRDMYPQFAVKPVWNYTLQAMQYPDPFMLAGNGGTPSPGARRPGVSWRDLADASDGSVSHAGTATFPHSARSLMVQAAPSSYSGASQLEATLERAVVEASHAIEAAASRGEDASHLHQVMGLLETASAFLTGAGDDADPWQSYRSSTRLDAPLEGVEPHIESDSDHAKTHQWLHRSVGGNRTPLPEEWGERDVGMQSGFDAEIAAEVATIASAAATTPSRPLSLAGSVAGTWQGALAAPPSARDTAPASALHHTPSRVDDVSSGVWPRATPGGSRVSTPATPAPPVSSWFSFLAVTPPTMPMA